MKTLTATITMSDKTYRTLATRDVAGAAATLDSFLSEAIENYIDAMFEYDDEAYTIMNDVSLTVNKEAA